MLSDPVQEMHRILEFNTYLLLVTGNDALHLLTTNKPCVLRVDLKDFQNNTAYATYSPFSIADSKNFYKLSLGTYSGTAGMDFFVFIILYVFIYLFKF